MAMGLIEMKNRVSVVIPSFNCKRILFRLLQSLKKSDYPNFEVIVIDNGSKDGTLNEGREKFRWVKWIDAGVENIGWGGAYNLGFAHAVKNKSCKYVLMIDSDVVIEPNMILKLVERAQKRKEVGIVTPMILYLSDKNWVNQAGAHVSLWTGKVSIGWGPKHKFQVARKVQNSGTAMLIRRKVVDKIGGFDDWFIGYLDPDYCLRAKKAGYETWYEPKAVAYHDQSKDQKVWGPRIFSRAYFLGRNRTLFMRRHGVNLLVYILFTPLLWAYYLREAIRYGVFSKWVKLVCGTLIGFFYPLNRKLKIALPKTS